MLLGTDPILVKPPDIELFGRRIGSLTGRLTKAKTGDLIDQNWRHHTTVYVHVYDTVQIALLS